MCGGADFLWNIRRIDNYKCGQQRRMVKEEENECKIVTLGIGKERNKEVSFWR